MGAPISSFSAITNDKLTLAKILDGLNPGCPSWNPAPLEHIGGELPCKDPYPIFRGIPGPKLRVPKEWPAFPGDIFNAAVSLVDRIEVECGAKMACQFRIVFEKLMGRRYSFSCACNL